MSGTAGQTASICPERLTKKVQDSCFAEGWPQTTPKQTAYKNRSLKKSGYILHIGDSTEESL